MIRRGQLLLALATVLVVCFIVGLAVAKKKPPSTPLDLNTASVEQLSELPGIGSATAKAIVQFREKSGPFRRVEDLLAIRGISQRRLDQLRLYVTVAKAKPAKP